jgi:hypothetical protein
MKIKLIIAYCLLLTATFFIAACQNEKDKEYSEIKSMEKILMESKERVNDSVALLLFDKYNMYAEKYKDDKNTPEFLFKSAELANAIGISERAVKIYRRLNTQYPEFDKAPESLFLCGFITENQLGDAVTAKIYYDEFLVKYPNHPLAKDVKASLEYLGKDPNDIVKEFEKRNK